MMSQRPQPVPPIFEPDVAADAIAYTAYSRRREVWVGGVTDEAIVANKFFPVCSIDMSLGMDMLGGAWR